MRTDRVFVILPNFINVIILRSTPYPKTEELLRPAKRTCLLSSTEDLLAPAPRPIKRWLSGPQR